METSGTAQGTEVVNLDAAADPEQSRLLDDAQHRKYSQPGAPGAGDGSATAQRAWLALYASHALSTWGQRMWEFAVGLLMLELRPGSLMLVSVFGLVDGGVQVLAGGAVGNYVGRSPRLQGACRMYVLQNSGVAASAAAALVLFWTGLRSGTAFWALVWAVIGCGAASSVGCQGSTLAVEKEWVKAMCQGDSALLGRRNAGMRRIDLTCLILSPIMVGVLMSAAGSLPAVLLILAWNLAAWAPECMLLSYCHARAPCLDSGKERDSAPAQPAPEAAASSSGRRALKSTAAAWRLYLGQRALPAALALALLYLTVMSLGLLMTAYLKWHGMDEATLSLARGLGAASGIAATFAFPSLQSRTGLLATGTLGIWCQALALWAGITPSLLLKAGWAPPNALVTYALVGGLVVSRFGLWTFDLAVSQLLQEWVADGELGAVSGVQGSLQSLFQTLAYALGILVHRAEDFAWLMAGSCCVVAAAAGVFTAFAIRVNAGDGTLCAPSFAVVPSDESAALEMGKLSPAGAAAE